MILLFFFNIFYSGFFLRLWSPSTCCQTFICPCAIYFICNVQVCSIMQPKAPCLICHARFALRTLRTCSVSATASQPLSGKFPSGQYSLSNLMLHCTHNLFLAAEFSYRKEKRGVRQSQQDARRPLLTWPKRTNVLVLKALFYLHTLLEYKDSSLCLDGVSLCHFFRWQSGHPLIKSDQCVLHLDRNKKESEVFTQKSWQREKHREQKHDASCQSAVPPSSCRQPTLRFLIRQSYRDG